jgi:thiamine transporter ThiT
MDDDILTMGVINLIFGVLALMIGFLYTLPPDHLLLEMSAPLALAIGDQ